MSNEVEQIEAKLAAYIDGELTAQERREIEAHLAANPSHAALVSDLMRHRTMVRALPREKAPFDMSEDLQGSLEREALLDEREHERPSILFRIFRAPQLLSAAAIVVLATGLGAVVFFMLPPKNPQVTFSPAPPGPAAVADRESDTDGGGLAEAASSAMPQSLAADRRMAEIQINPTDPAGAVAAESRAPARVDDLAMAGLASLVGDNTLVLTVSSLDADQAQREVVSYLASNGIAWTAPPGATETVALYDSAGTVREAAKSDATVPAEPLATEMRGAALKPESLPEAIKEEQKDALAAGGPETQVRQQAQAPLASETLRMRRAEAGQDAPPAASSGAIAGAGGGAAPSQRAALPSTTQPVQETLEKENLNDSQSRFAVRSDMHPGGLSAQQTSPAAAALPPLERPAAEGTLQLNPTTLQVVGEFATTANGFTLQQKSQPRAHLIVARNLNRQQVDDLTRSLSRADRHQVASVQAAATFYADLGLMQTPLDQGSATGAATQPGFGIGGRANSISPARRPVSDDSYARSLTINEQNSPVSSDEAFKKSLSGAVTLELAPPATQIASFNCVIVVREAPPAPVAAPQTLPATVPSR